MNARQRKKIGLPYMVTAWLDGHVRFCSNRELHRAFYRLGSEGVDYIRIFPYWKDTLLPYCKVNGVYDLNMFNSLYWSELKRFCNIAYQWQIGIWFDLFDQCGFKNYVEWENPWVMNKQNINGIYQTTPYAIKYYTEWITKVITTVGLYGYRTTRLGIKLRNKPNWFGLGNELDYPGPRSKTHEWAEVWGHGLAEYMRKLGYKQKILFSGSEDTAHALRVYIGPWDGRPENKPKWDREFKVDETVDCWHGFYRWPQLVEKHLYNHSTGEYKVTNNRWFGVSDDGLNVTDGYHARYNPPIDDAPSTFKAAGTDQVIRACKGFKKWLDENKGYAKWHHIEQLPRSVSEQSQDVGQLHQDRDVNIYKRIARQTWGVDITRRYPKWQREKYL